MNGKALELMKDYLFKRFIQVVCNGKSSFVREIFSGVPQGAKWSPSIWDFDISELPSAISLSGIVFCYADDSGLWYRVTLENRSSIVDTINSDLRALMIWGNDNKTTFEPAKTSMMVVSQKRTPFDPSGIVMDGVAVETVSEMKLVGFTFDSKMRWGAMIDRAASKARTRLAALRRLSGLLDARNLRTMYMMFVRSTMEYGNVLYMGAADSHLAKLDRIQTSAERICGFKMESLSSRRDAAAFSLAVKMLSGKGRGILNDFTPQLYHIPESTNSTRTRSSSLTGFQVQSQITTKSLDVTRRGFAGAIPRIFAALPQPWIKFGVLNEWQMIEARCKQFLLSPNMLVEVKSSGRTVTSRRKI
jgi:hypothetical protein